MLVVYHTRDGNTRKVAEALATACHGDLEEVREVGVNRKGLRGWLYAGRDAMRQKTSAIESEGKRPGDYDVVCVGSPVWAGNVAPAIRTYLSERGTEAKKLALFCTMGSSSAGGIFASMRALVPAASILGELAVPQREVRDADALRARVEEWVAQVIRA
mgnify:CR=1 FL=1